MQRQGLETYTPYGALRHFFANKDKEVVLVGPKGTGKSLAALTKQYVLGCKYPGSRHLITRRTRKALTTSALVTLERDVLGMSHPMTAGPGRGNRAEYKFPNGSVWAVLSLEDPQRIMSSEWDTIYIQEVLECDLEHWEMAVGCLRSWKMPYQQLFGCTNPGAPTHWIRERISKGVLTELRTEHRDNPRIFDHDRGEWTAEGKDYLETLSQLTGARRKRLFLGEWAAAEGARWPILDKDVHQFQFKRTFPNGLPQSAGVIIGYDWGIAAPACGLWVYVKPVDAPRKKDFYVLREMYEADLPPDVQARKVLQHTRANERVLVFRHDPQMHASPRTLTGHKQKSLFSLFVETWKHEGVTMPCEDGFNQDRSHAEGTIDVLLARDNGFPDLYIEEGCTNLWRELTSAIWDEKGRDQVDGSCDDHAITALYYALHAEIATPHLAKSFADVLRDYEWAQQKQLLKAEEASLARHREQLRFGIG